MRNRILITTGILVALSAPYWGYFTPVHEPGTFVVLGVGLVTFSRLGKNIDKI